MSQKYIEDHKINREVFSSLYGIIFLLSMILSLGTTHNNKNCFSGKVNHKENLGSDIYIHVTLKDSKQKMIVRSNPDISFNTKIGETIRIGFDTKKVMIFNESGQNLKKKS